MAITLSGDGIARANLAADIIDSTKLADNAVDTEHLADDAVDSDEIAAGAIDTAHIGANQVTAAKVAADVATQAELDTVSTVASAALPKAGGTMTGDIAHAGNFTINTDGNIALDNGSNNIVLLKDGAQYGLLTASSGNLIIKSGATTAITFANAAATFASTIVAGSNITANGNLTATGGFVNATGSGTGGGYQFADGNAMIYRDTNDLAFKLQGSEKMRIKSDGNVGIGASSPSAPLQIRTELSSVTQSTPETVLLLETTAGSGNMVAGNGTRILFKISDDETNPSVGASIDAVRENADDSISSTALVLSTSQNDETLDEALRIDSNGKVGIGTTSPATSLDVGGDFATENTRTYQVTRGASTLALSLLTSDHTQNYSSGRWYTVKGSTCGPGNAGKEGMYEFTLRAYSGDGTGGSGVYNFAIEETTSTLYGTATNSIPVLSWSGSGGSRTLVLTAPTWVGSSGIVEYGGYEAQPQYITWLAI